MSIIKEESVSPERLRELRTDSEVSMNYDSRTKMLPPNAAVDPEDPQNTALSKISKKKPRTIIEAIPEVASNEEPSKERIETPFLDSRAEAPVMLLIGD